MTSKEIYNNLFELHKDRGNNDTIISIVDTNMDIINNDLANNNEETHHYTTMIISLYAELVYHKEKYNIALPFLERAIFLWESNTLYELIDLENEWYLSLRFHRGIANYRLKKMSKAKEDFSWLRNQDPQNELYRIWMIDAKNYYLDITGRNLTIFFAALLTGIMILLPKEEVTLQSQLFAAFSFCLISLPLLAIIQWIRRKWLQAKYSKV